MTEFLGRLLGLENLDTLDDASLSLAAPWVQSRAGLAALVLCCAAAVVLAGLFYARFQQRGRKSARALLFVSRAGLLCLLLLILAEPVLVRTFTQHPKPQLWVLFDGSDSMDIQDELPDAQRDALAAATGLKPKTADEKLARVDYLRSLLTNTDSRLLEQLEQKFRVKTFLFEDALRELPDFASWTISREEAAKHLTTEGQVTSLGGALGELSRRGAGGRLAGVVVFSDFNQNSGPSADEAAARLETPVFAVGIGPPAASDLRVRLDAPLWMTKEEREEITVFVEQEGLDAPAVKVRLMVRKIGDEGDPGPDAAKQVDEKEVQLIGEDGQPRLGPLAAAFPYTPDTTGQFIFTAAVDPLPGETIDQNNTAEREVSIRDDFFRLMYVEHEPTYEWRFIKEVFHRDKLVGMRGFRTFLRSADPQVRRENELFLTTMVPKRGEFFSSDVIFLGDMPQGVLSTRFCEMTKEFVEKFGGGLVVISGPRFGPGELADTPLADMLPVEVDADLKLRDESEFALQLTARSEEFPFMRLGESDAENRKAWANLDRLPWYQPVARPRKSATVLATHPEHRCEDGTLQPLIAVRKYGAGTVIYLAFDETFRLRRKYGEKYYRQFWGQMIHQLASYRALGSQKRFTVEPDRREYRTGDTAILTVRAFDANYEPLPDDKLPDGKLSATVILPSGGGEREKQYVVTRLRNEDFETRLTLDAPGEYRVRVPDPIEPGKFAETKFRVTDVSAERQIAVRNVALQNALANVNPGGKAYELHQAANLTNDIIAPPLEETIIEVQPLWSTWLCFALVMLLMLGEWLGRKLATLP